MTDLTARTNLGSNASDHSTTMLLKIGEGWAVCTRTAVPIILARFAHREAARSWQSGHEQRTRAAA
jgi:hypothetical protein